MLVSAVVAIDTESGKQQVLFYKNDGVIRHISQAYPIMSFYGLKFGYRVMYDCGSCHTIKANNNYNNYLRLQEDKPEVMHDSTDEDKKKTRWLSRLLNRK